MFSFNAGMERKSHFSRWPEDNGETMLEELQEELNLFKLLNQLFLPEPSRELLLGLSTISIPGSGDQDDLGTGLQLLIKTSQKNEQRLDAWREDLAVEYTRLFLGPKSPPAVPFASFYLSGNRALMTEETIGVRLKYMDSGMAVKQLYQVPDDHIAIELEFLYYLTKQACEAVESGDVATAQREIGARNDFVVSHLLLWAPTFADKIIEHTTDDFYKGAAYMLKGTVADFAQ